ncbi:MAG: hypothetical protein PF481_10930 [Bacteroidales bacterium]|jgi:hypothetical protein|nr:hypothetical protein [Bacteroidales bacterium]
MKHYYIKLSCLFIFLLLKNTVFSQNIQENLAKYWLYRDRLDKYFVIVDENTEKAGTNHPFFYLNKKWTRTDSNLYHCLSTGDGNDQMQYYIGMLATEYALLKKYNQDYTKTRNQLLYALQSVQRFDKYAESYFRDIGEENFKDIPLFEHENGYITGGKKLFATENIGDRYNIPNYDFYEEGDVNEEGDINGFMIRNDIYAHFIEDNSFDYPFLNNYCTETSGMDGRMKTNMPHEMSKDNVWNYLVNFALVKILVDDAEIQSLLKELTTNMISCMHGTYDELWYVDEIWVIRNPVTGNIAYEGGVVEEVGVGMSELGGYKYAFAEAGNFIVNKYKNGDLDLATNLHYSTSHRAKNEFYSSMSLFTELNEAPQRFKYLMLATVMGDDKHYDNWPLTFPNRSTVMWELLKNIENGRTQAEHLPLIRKLIIEYQIDRDNYRNYRCRTVFEKKQNLLDDIYMPLLNEAPICGPHNFDLPDRTPNWSVENRLTLSHCIVQNFEDIKDINNDLYGVFNGIDYMLLHNLVWLVYYSNLEDILYLKDTDVRKGYDANKIISEQDILENEIADYNAGEIELQSGFTVKKGGYFEANINDNVSYMYI